MSKLKNKLKSTVAKLKKSKDPLAGKLDKIKKEVDDASTKFEDAYAQLKINFKNYEGTPFKQHVAALKALGEVEKQAKALVKATNAYAKAYKNGLPLFKLIKDWT